MVYIYICSSYMERSLKNVYDRPAMDFVAVATEFCRTLESCAGAPRPEFMRVMRGLLPMLYLKAELLPGYPDGEGYVQPCVTEGDYDFVRGNVAGVMRDLDDFLDVFVDDFKYSDQPVLCTVSECLADVYQPLRDFVEAYRGGSEEAMSVALAGAREQFRTLWGQKALNALRAIHDAGFRQEDGAEL